ncbi:hypothetical protein [Brevibacterium aurantiacum]|uniref:Capsular biosynthesis protein n=1 Tax=Brevibacterium aurantiacum TaxID=273384 RepID=A0A2A3YXM9_BREAU|nr:hypothetical protein [Brevibacterium aurantiacum]PCC44090.1 hypothetical protein CIK65_05765 [Brevibacterium aurantiacum]
MILIPSGQFVQGDLRSEFGDVPPAFLPLGNRPLYVWQIDVLRDSFPDDRIIMSVPETFNLEPSSERELSRLGCDVVKVPSSLSLAESILLVLNISGFDPAAPLRILHGDTYVPSLPLGKDLIGIASSKDQYEWQFADVNARHSVDIWCGYFSFSNVPEFVRSLAISRGSFVGAVQRYAESISTNFVPISGWMDSGHLNTYFRVREQFTTERHFNNLVVKEGSVTKSGSPSRKIRAEANWFNALPGDLRVYAPQLLFRDDLRAEYRIEYLPMPPLNELYVHGRLSVPFWEQVFGYCDKWFSKARVSASGGADTSLLRHELVSVKTWDRLEQLRQVSQVDLDRPLKINGMEAPSLRCIVEQCIGVAESAPYIEGVMHGDFCFSNIILDSRAGRIRLIDPRGIEGTDSQLLVGDLLYDLAKLAHSAVGFYDLIIAGMFDVEGDLRSGEVTLEIHVSSLQKEIAELFLSRGFLGVSQGDIKAVMAIVVLLFISMVPLHADVAERQLAFVANAVRIYREYLGD